jgi:hypothetical protein
VADNCITATDTIAISPTLGLVSIELRALCGQIPTDAGMRWHPVLYVRVGTAEHTIVHQLADARAAGFAIHEFIADDGVSRLSTRLIEARKAGACSTSSGPATCSSSAGSWSVIPRMCAT